MVLLVLAGGCAAVRSRGPESTVGPSNQRDWQPNLAVLPVAEFDGDRVTVRNIRNTLYLSEDDYVVRHYDKTFDLQKIVSLDFVVVPFETIPSLAHTMLSFGFQDGDFVAISAEARLEKNERYSATQGALGQFELMYVVGDERDLIGLRSLHRKSDVYVYRTTATPEQVRTVFVDMLQRANQLAEQPELYHTLTNNCTTNIVQHIERLFPGRILWDPRIFLPGYADRLAYEQGLLAADVSFEATQRRAYVNERVARFAESPSFSDLIRR